MFLIIGAKYFTWGSQPTNEQIRCSQCGIVAPFTEKTGMRFLTLFFIIPTIPELTQFFEVSKITIYSWFDN